MPSKALVIGYGSPIRGDDAIGPLAADRLEADGLPEHVQVIARHILTADLVPDIAACELVVFLDAAAHGPPGDLRCEALHADPTALSTMAHFLDPRELLAWCESLYGRHPEAWMVSVTGVSFDYAGYELTPAAQAALGPMLAKVRELVGA